MGSRYKSSTPLAPMILLVLLGSFVAAFMTVRALNLKPFSTTSPANIIPASIQEILEHPEDWLGSKVAVSGTLVMKQPEQHIGVATYLQDDSGNMIEIYGPPPMGLPYGSLVDVIGTVELWGDKILLHVESIHKSGELVYQRYPGHEAKTTVTVTVTVTVHHTETVKEVEVSGGSQTPDQGETQTNLSEMIMSPTFLAIWLIYLVIGVGIAAALAKA